MRVLLISNSTLHGSGYLDHCAPAIEQFLRPDVSRVLFVPYALSDRDAYAARAQERFARMGFELESIHKAAGRPAEAVERAEAIFIGGGNTFRLLDALWRDELIEPIRRRVRAGLPYIGSSAGSNVACATIKTTNDMPIVQPPTFDGPEPRAVQHQPALSRPATGLDAHGRDARGADRAVSRGEPAAGGRLAGRRVAAGRRSRGDARRTDRRAVVQEGTGS